MPRYYVGLCYLPNGSPNGRGDSHVFRLHQRDDGAREWFVDGSPATPEQVKHLDANWHPGRSTATPEAGEPLRPIYAVPHPEEEP